MHPVVFGRERRERKERRERMERGKGKREAWGFENDVREGFETKTEMMMAGRWLTLVSCRVLM